MPDYPCDEDGGYDEYDDREDVNSFGLEDDVYEADE